jgi:glycosyltransferase involved in cell wall biosynthesis
LALIGTKEDPQYLLEVEALIASEGLTEEVKLVGSTVDLKPWFDKARMGVLSSHIEGLPVSLLELGLSGVPLISSEVGACGSLLEGGRCGYLVAPGSVDQLASAMASLVDHPQETKSKAILFEQKVRDEFGGDKFFRAYKTLIKN